MNLTKVTITGADDAVHPESLLELQEQYPFVEWGILFSKSQEGLERYPSRGKRALFEVDYPPKLNLSAHFCGGYTREVLEQDKFDHLVCCFVYGYKRVQLNYNFSVSKRWSFDKLIKLMDNNKDRSIILQYNKSNAPYLDVLHDLPDNFHFLYDSSGGRGNFGSDLLTRLPFSYRFTGYAGGLNPDNVEELVSTFATESTYFPIKDNYWIDMESGVRTDNHFHLNKVKQVLEICKKYVK
jgi:phosphoribosylanthranilate isomerase